MNNLQRNAEPDLMIQNTTTNSLGVANRDMLRAQRR